jgi:thiosulfate/3-mercaptopyruvate sulfurtransferase
MSRVQRLLVLLSVVATSAGAQSDTRAAMLVSPQWLQQHITDPKLVLLHIGTKAEYDTAHIAGAQFVTLNDIGAPRDTGARALSTEMAAPADLRAKLSRFGISDDSRVVVYFGKDQTSPATRIVLTLEVAGLGGSTSLLDGGMPAWIAAGHPTTKDVPPARSGTLGALTLKPLIVSGEWVRDNATKPGIALIDARATAFYDGTSEGGPQSARRRGHIPGAINVPYTSMFTEKNALKSADELRDIFAKAGIKQGDTVVAYCHIGQQATAVIFAARSLGFKTVLYDGSFEDWALRDWTVAK